MTSNKLGYGNPPKDYQFKPGKSGNPKGRPKESKNTATILNNALSRKIKIVINGTEIKVTKKEALLESLVNKALKGDTKATGLILANLEKIEEKELLKAEQIESISRDDKLILERFLEKNKDFKGDKND